MDRVGPVVWEGFTFDGGYTDRVTSGDGDLLTADGLWDLKVSRWPPNPTYTLQLLVYWRLGLHSTHPEYLRCGVWACTTRGRTRCGAFPWPGSAPMPCVRWSGM